MPELDECISCDLESKNLCLCGFCIFCCVEGCYDDEEPVRD